jgi:hypothetical protein
LKKLNIDCCPAAFFGAAFPPTAEVLPVPPDFRPLVTAAPAFVFATGAFLPATEPCDSDCESASSPFVETDVVEALRLSGLAFAAGFFPF